MIAFVGTFSLLRRLCSLLQLGSGASPGPADGSEHSAVAGLADFRQATAEARRKLTLGLRHDGPEDALLPVRACRQTRSGFGGLVP